MADAKTTEQKIDDMWRSWDLVLSRMDEHHKVLFGKDGIRDTLQVVALNQMGCPARRAFRWQTIVSIIATIGIVVGVIQGIRQMAQMQREIQTLVEEKSNGSINRPNIAH